MTYATYAKTPTTVLREKGNATGRRCDEGVGEWGRMQLRESVLRTGEWWRESPKVPIRLYDSVIRPNRRAAIMSATLYRALKSNHGAGW